MAHRYSLIIDQGNSSTKVAVFRNREIVQSFRFSDGNLNHGLDEILKSVSPSIGLMSSVRDLKREIISTDAWRFPVLRFSSDLPIPINISYSTPQTLGSDRIANGCAVNALYPNKTNLVIDFGTCITYTFLQSGSLLGGGISPGIQMRFRALHQFTGKLPDLSGVISDEVPLVGTDTEKSIFSGVWHGCLCEVEGIIANYCSTNADINVIITGGDAEYFASHLKSPIFAIPNLTLQGLFEILAFQHEYA